jgi:hypothetical protein
MGSKQPLCISVCVCVGGGGGGGACVGLSLFQIPLRACSF